MKGNYSEGFGKLKPQQEHDLKSGLWVFEICSWPKGKASSQDFAGNQEERATANKSTVQLQEEGPKSSEEESHKREQLEGLKIKAPEQAKEEGEHIEQGRVNGKSDVQPTNADGKLNGDGKEWSKDEVSKKKWQPVPTEQNKCVGCGKTVYHAEQLQALGIWHRGCFKCQGCSLRLQVRC